MAAAATGSSILSGINSIASVRSAQSVRRISHEYSNMRKAEAIQDDPKASKQLEYRFKLSLPDQDDISIWDVYITKLSLNGDTALDKQMVEHKIPHIHIHIRFPVDYPFSPPFIHVVTPKFVAFKGHITEQGAFCTDILMPASWTPARKIPDLIYDLFLLASFAGAEIDPKRTGHVSTYEEALVSFNSLKNSHRDWVVGPNPTNG